MFIKFKKRTIKQMNKQQNRNTHNKKQKLNRNNAKITRAKNKPDRPAPIIRRHMRHTHKMCAGDSGRRSICVRTSSDCGAPKNGHTAHCMYTKMRVDQSCGLIARHAATEKKHKKQTKTCKSKTRQHAHPTHHKTQTQNTSTRKPKTRQCANPQHDAQTQNATTLKSETRQRANPDTTTINPKARHRPTRQSTKLTINKKHDKQLHGTKKGKGERERERQLQPFGLCP